MTVWSAGLRLQSATRSCAELAALLGREASDSSEKGAPVSSQNPSGPVRAVSTCTFDSGITDSDLEPHVTALADLLGRLGAEAPDDVARDLSVGANGRPLGWVFELSPQAMRLLAGAQCGLFFDVYCDDPSDLQQAPDRPQGEGGVPA